MFTSTSPVMVMSSRTMETSGSRCNNSSTVHRKERGMSTMTAVLATDSRQGARNPCPHDEVERDSYGHLSCQVCRTSFESSSRQ